MTNQLLHNSGGIEHAFFLKGATGIPHSVVLSGFITACGYHLFALVFLLASLLSSATLLGISAFLRRKRLRTSHVSSDRGNP
jgi:hypothetical protein